MKRHFFKVALNKLLTSYQQSVIKLPQWPHRLAVRTTASHAVNRGSIPLGVTINISRTLRFIVESFFCLFVEWIKSGGAEKKERKFVREVTYG